MGLTCAVIAFCGLMMMTSSAPAQLAGERPKDLEGVGIDDRRGETVPLDVQFVDHTGTPCRLGDLFDGRRSVILTLNYADCPMLCGLQLRGLVDVLGKLDWTLGDEFRVVTVSINPRETPERAATAQSNYLLAYGETATDDGWTILTGDEANIRRLADAVGFGYRYVPERGEYAHSAALMVCTPDGVVSRYLYGIEYDPTTLRLSLVEAADGQIGSAMDQLLLFCFHYDATKGRYGPAAMNLMRAGGAVVLVIVGGMLWYFRRWERRRSRQAAENQKHDLRPLLDTPVGSGAL